MNKLFTLTLLILLSALFAGAKDHEPTNNTFGGADGLTITSTDTARIQPAGDVDFFKVTVPQCGVLVLNLTNIPGLNLQMSVYSAANSDSVIAYSNFGGNRSLEVSVSPGDYYIQVSDHYGATSATEYILAINLDTNDRGECNNNFSLAYSIPDSTTFKAEIRGANSLRKPAVDVDYYKVHITQCGVLVLNLANIPGLNVEMYVYSAANSDSLIGYSGFGGNRALELLVPAGDYYIEVNDHYNQTSATPYGLTVSFDNSDVGECNNSFAAAHPIADNTTFNAKIRGTNNLRIPVIDVDYYKVHINRCGVLVLNLANIPGLNVEMTVYSAPNDTSSIGYSGFGGNRNLELLVSPGDYYILVNDHYNQTSAIPYGLTVSFDSSNACGCNYTIATACSISDSTKFQAKIRGTSGTFIDVNYYKVNVDRCGVLVLNLGNIPGLNIEMTVYRGDSTDSIVGYSGFGGNRNLELLVSSGEYFIKVNDHYNQTSANPYSLTVSFDSSDVGECDNSFAAAYPIPDNTSFQAKIRGTNGLRNPVIDVDYYKVHIDECGVLVLNLANIPGLNVEMTVYNAPNDTSSIGYSGFGGNRDLELLVTAGDYYIKVDDHYNQTSATPYGLTVSFDSSDACECNNTLATACTIASSTTFNAKIRGTNSTFTPTTDVDYYKVDFPLCGQLVINLTNIPGLNVEMTAYQASNDSQIAYSGFGGNRSITLNLRPTQIYLLVDDHYSQTSATPYTLALSFTPIPAVPVITPSGPLDFCTGNNIVLKSSAATNNYWSTGATIDSIIVTASGTFIDTVRISNGCAAPSLPVMVEVDSLPKVPVITPSGPTTFCAGGSITLNSSSATNNFWSTGDNLQSIAVAASATFIDTVKSNPGCFSVSDSVSVTVNPVPSVPTITPSGKVAICQGVDSLLLSSSSTDNHWSNGKTASGIIVNTAGIYTDTVRYSTGCLAISAPDTVTISSLAVASFNVSSINVTYTFTNTSANGTNYLWKFGDGDTSHAVSPVHTYKTNSTDSVTLITTNGCGSDTIVGVISVINGINEVTKPTPLTIVPDPCTQCELIGEVDTKDLLITDVIGRTCNATFSKTSRGYYITIQGTPSGIFFLRDLKTGEVIKFVRE